MRLLAFGLLLLTACSAAVIATPIAPTDVAPLTAAPPAPTITPVPDPAAVPTSTPLPESDVVGDCSDPFEGIQIRFATQYWTTTDFCNHSVDYGEIFSGGPPPDGIPAIDDPVFESVESADEWLENEWPVLFFEANGEARAYPLAILIWHEIVNDEVAGQKVALTFCPLCNSTIAFNSVLADGTVLDFGTSGNLRNSDLVMYDRQTRSWWQQFTGEAIVGQLTGTMLEMLPSQIISWSDFKQTHPDSLVLSRDTGNTRNYGSNPYGGYDDVGRSPFFPVGKYGDELPPIERIVALTLGDIDVAFPFSLLAEVGVANEEYAGQPIVIFWKWGTHTAFGNTDKDVGASGAFSRELEGQILTFEAAEGGFADLETGSFWTLTGEAIEGPLSGNQLNRLVSGEHFWFAWSVFRPDTIVWQP
ncbi:MAG: DUF3179 domain-containing protein [Chloroflexi bacterium]|nr:DUF3179 domain-containing protein [Chloroflexota bacterium]